MAELMVYLVATDRPIFRGNAKLVVFETVDGQVGIMPQHSPMMGVLRDAPVLIRTDEGDRYAAVHGGFVTVDRDQVMILAEIAEMSEEIDVAEVKRHITELGTPAADDDVTKARIKKAEVRLDVAARAGSVHLH